MNIQDHLSADRCVDRECMDVWMDGWMDGWIDGWMDGWMDVCTAGPMDGWINY